MRGRWGVALAAAIAVASGARGAEGFRGSLGSWSGTAGDNGGPAGRASGGEPCTLSRVERAKTTSSACLACHDGGVAPAVGFEMRAGGGGFGHPVSVDYGRAASEHPTQYAPAGALPREIPLVNGRIECTTCHDGASATAKHVVDTQQLCLACHRL
ncbi:MAG TPA: cytochrome c3 family protein [Anaeromyxobacter sp.]